MELDLEARVDAPISAVWGFLTDPERMNRWSTARIEPIDPGEGGRMDGVGALRRVITPGASSTRLKEVIRTSEPPHRFVYVVFDGAPALRAHRGEITLAESNGVTRVRWCVQMDFVLPGLATIARRSIGPELARSLDVLARVARGAPGETLAASKPFAHAPLEPLRAEADRVLVAQRAIAERLQAARDPKQWFARVYQFVTEEQLAFLDRGEVDHPDWVLRLVPTFHRFYLEGLEGFEAGRAIAPEWQKAWSVASRHTGTRDVIRGLLLGVAAHIETDLPRALAETHRAHFAAHDLVRFRADYVRMAPVFRIASDRLVARMPTSHLPLWLRAARAAMPAEMGGELMRRYYDVPKRRLEAFARGAQLAR